MIGMLDITVVLREMSHVQGEQGRVMHWERGKGTNLDTIFSSQQSIIHNIYGGRTKERGKTKN
jgi:hypothetical protein